MRALIPLVLAICISSCSGSSFSGGSSSGDKKSSNQGAQSPTPSGPPGSSTPGNIGVQASSLKVVVVDALNKNPIPGAAITVAPGGPGGTTDASGSYVFNQIAVGANGLTVAATNYISQSQAITGTTGEVHFALSPALKPDQIRVVLSWGAAPSDLDSHLSAQLTTGKKYHIWWNHREGQNANLDVDCTDSYGPETLTVNGLLPGHYQYQVADYVAYQNKDPGQLPISAGIVRLYVGNQPVQTFTVPAASAGLIWDVFNFDIDANGHVTVTPINKYDDASSLKVDWM